MKKAQTILNKETKGKSLLSDSIFRNLENELICVDIKCRGWGEVAGTWRGWVSVEGKRSRKYLERFWFHRCPPVSEWSILQQLNNILICVNCFSAKLQKEWSSNVFIGCEQRAIQTHTHKHGAH